MRLKTGSVIATLVIVVTLVTACGPAEQPATLVPVQATPTNIPATLVPIQPTRTDAPATPVPIQPTPTNAPATPVPVQPTPTPAAPTVTQPPAPSQWPSARKYGAMVYDPLSERVFMFGGVKRLYDAVDIPEVWAYEPATESWQEQGKLGPRVVICAAFDEESQRAIVFGRSDTWAYDPAADTWEKMKPVATPSLRWACQMAYDAESDRIVLFGGGTGAAQSFDDTWVYDYNTDTWEELQPEVSPPARAYHGMAYDPGNDRVMLWGGHTLPNESDLRAWAYDYNTNTWMTQEAPSDAPEQRNGLGLFYHSPSGRMIVYGGLTENDGQLVEGDTWAYDYRANSWQALTPSQSPGKRAHFLMSYAPSIDKAILFGGELVSKAADEISDETWVFDPTTNEWQSVMRP